MVLKLLTTDWCFHYILSPLLKRPNVKIIIGITQDPAQIGDCIARYHGEQKSLTELGPFVSRVDALNWLTYLKSRIGDFEEIYSTAEEDNEAVWHGFTFEQQTDHS